MKRILVTGASGQLGLCIKEIQTKYPQLYFFFKNSIELNILDAKRLTEVFQENEIDYCINCAAYTNVEMAEQFPNKAFEINAEGVRQLASACKVKNVILIHISTDYVFDGKKNTPYNTDDITLPINNYGKSKLQGEKYIQAILSNHFIVRTSWLYSTYGNNFYLKVLNKARNGENLTITDAQVGCPTNGLNLAAYLIEIILRNSENFGIYHFTDNEVMTWYEFAKKIIQENHLENTTKIVRDNNYRSFVARPQYSVLSTEVMPF